MKFTQGLSWSLLLLACLSGSVLAQEGAEEAAPVDEEDDFFIFDEPETSTPTIADPLEPFNRLMFDVNDKLYRYVVKPVAQGLRVLPRPVRQSTANVIDNLGRPVSVINALLQLDLRNAGTELGRFAVNSTLGILGLFDPATDMGLVADNEDLGQTLGRYRIGHGFYLVLPFGGPSSLRDAVGSVGNYAMDPFLTSLKREERVAVVVLDAEIAFSLDPDNYEALYDRSIDPYSFFRSAYIQNRAGQVER